MSHSPACAGGMVEFRRSLASSFLFRFFVHVASQLERDLPGFQPMFPDTYKSAAVPFHRPPVQGLQYWSKVPGEAVVGQPTRHMAADLQVCSPRLHCIFALLHPAGGKNGKKHHFFLRCKLFSSNR